MTELGIDGTMRELLCGLRGREVSQLYANRSQVALVYPDGVVDIQPACRRVDPGHSTDEACFAAARFTPGHDEELPRDEPVARDVTLTSIWSVRTRLCFASTDGGTWRRLTGRSSPASSREWVSDPDGRTHEDEASSSYEVEAGLILDFGGRAVAVFCAGNDYRFAFSDDAPFEDAAAIRRRYAEHYRFREL